MAYYNNYGNYPMYYGQQYPQQMQMQQQIPNTMQTQQAQTQPQIQNGGFVSIRSELDAFNYPIAVGTSITFKDENAPFIYVKTKGFSQLETPTFEKYRLVKEEDIQKQVETQQIPQQQQVPIDYVTHKEIEQLQVQIQDELNALKNQFLSIDTAMISNAPKREVKQDEKSNA